MGKLIIALEKQLLTDQKEDATNCIKIYNKLKESTGGVWESTWNPLVSTSFVGTYPYQRRYKPTNIGEIFLKGINKE